MSHAYILLGITRLKLCTRVTGFRAIHNHTHVIMIVIHRQIPQCTHKTRRAPRCAVRAAPARPGRHASLGKGTGHARIERVMHEPQTRPRVSASRMFCSDVLGEVLGELLRFCEVASSTLSCATGVHFEQRGGRFARKAYESYTNPTLYKVLAF